MRITDRIKRHDQKPHAHQRGTRQRHGRVILAKVRQVAVTIRQRSQGLRKLNGATLLVMEEVPVIAEELYQRLIDIPRHDDTSSRARARATKSPTDRVSARQVG